MREAEPRYPCPVCLGVRMEKTPVGQGGELCLDHCRRCGGVWFELGELQKLRQCRPQALWARIPERPGSHRMHCHGCHALLDRNAETCPACGWRNVLDCPACARPMRPAAHEGVKLDACSACKGVWFDHAELAAVWNLRLGTALERRPRAGGSLDALPDDRFLLDVLVWHPELVYFGARAAGHAALASAEALSRAPEAAAGLAEAAGEAATGIFELVAQILGGLFD